MLTCTSETVGNVAAHEPNLKADLAALCVHGETQKFHKTTFSRMYHLDYPAFFIYLLNSILDRIPRFVDAVNMAATIRLGEEWLIRYEDRVEVN